MTAKKSAQPKISPTTSTISNCEINALKFDAQSIAAVNIIAEAILVNAKACRDVAAIFSIQHIELECLVKMVGGESILTGNVATNPVKKP